MQKTKRMSTSTATTLYSLTSAVGVTDERETNPLIIKYLNDITNDRGKVEIKKGIMSGGTDILMASRSDICSSNCDSNSNNASTTCKQSVVFNSSVGVDVGAYQSSLSLLRTYSSALAATLPIPASCEFLIQSGSSTSRAATARATSSSVLEASMGSIVQPSTRKKIWSDIMCPHSSNVRMVNVTPPSSSSSSWGGSQSNDDDINSTSPGNAKSQTASERLKRSRERNRIHARKTRQRKKEQMSNLQERASELKEEQLRLKQNINEKNTATILLGLFSNSASSTCRSSTSKTITMENGSIAGESGRKCKTRKFQENGVEKENPRVEALLRRSIDDIPDASKITELPALILPGQHNSRRTKRAAADAVAVSTPTSTSTSNTAAYNSDVSPNDGIDYKLLGKERAQCSPEELDRIRRERNRMHAKRTRDRKRIFMEEMIEMCKRLEEDNTVLREHLGSLTTSPGNRQSSVQNQVENCSSIISATHYDNSSDVMNDNGNESMQADIVKTRYWPEKRLKLSHPISVELTTGGGQPNESSTWECTSSPASSAIASPPYYASRKEGGITRFQLQTLLEAAGAFDKSTAITTTLNHNNPRQHDPEAYIPSPPSLLLPLFNQYR